MHCNFNTTIVGPPVGVALFAIIFVALKRPCSNLLPEIMQRNKAQQYTLGTTARKEPRPALPHPENAPTR